jgi:hypothetical protein
MADRIDFPFNRQAVKPLDRQRDKNLDAVLELEIRLTECSALPRLGAGDGGWSGTPQWAVTGLPGHTGHASAAA